VPGRLSTKSSVVAFPAPAKAKNPAAVALGKLGGSKGGIFGATGSPRSVERKSPSGRVKPAGRRHVRTRRSRLTPHAGRVAASGGIGISTTIVTSPTAVVMVILAVEICNVTVPSTSVHLPFRHVPFC
jgi:hypothetical protein